MKSHGFFKHESKENNELKALLDTVTSYFDVYIAPNLDFLLNSENSTERVLNTIKAGLDMNQTEYRSYLANRTYPDRENDNINLIYRVIHTLLTTNLTKIDTLGNSLTKMKINLTDKTTAVVQSQLLMLIFSALNNKQRLCEI